MGKKLAEEEQDILPKDDLLMLESEWLGDMWNSMKFVRIEGWLRRVLAE